MKGEIKQLFEMITLRIIKLFLSQRPQPARGLYEDGLARLPAMMERLLKIIKILPTLRKLFFSSPDCQLLPLATASSRVPPIPRANRPIPRGNRPILLSNRPIRRGNRPRFSL